MRLFPIPPDRSSMLRFPKLANLGEWVDPTLLGYSQVYLFAMGSHQSIQLKDNHAASFRGFELQWQEEDPIL